MLNETIVIIIYVASLILFVCSFCFYCEDKNFLKESKRCLELSKQLEKFNYKIAENNKDRERNLNMIQEELINMEDNIAKREKAFEQLKENYFSEKGIICSTIEGVLK